MVEQRLVRIVRKQTMFRVTSMSWKDTTYKSIRIRICGWNIPKQDGDVWRSNVAIINTDKFEWHLTWFWLNRFDKKEKKHVYKNKGYPFKSREIFFFSFRFASLSLTIVKWRSGNCATKSSRNKIRNKTLDNREKSNWLFTSSKLNPIQQTYFPSLIQNTCRRH